MFIPKASDIPLIRIGMHQCGVLPQWSGMAGIYGLYEGDRAWYIGESKDLHERFAQHIQEIYTVMGGWWKDEKNIPQPVYFELNRCFHAMTLNFRVLRENVLEKSERLLIEKEFTIQHGQQGLYNKSSAKDPKWKVIRTHPLRDKAIQDLKAFNDAFEPHLR